MVEQWISTKVLFHSNAMFYLQYSLPIVFPQWPFNLGGWSRTRRRGVPSWLTPLHLDELLTDHLFKGCKVVGWRRVDGKRGSIAKEKKEIIWKVWLTACIFRASIVFDGSQKKVSLRCFPNFEVCRKRRLPPKRHSQHPGYPDAAGHAGGTRSQKDTKWQNQIRIWAFLRLLQYCTLSSLLIIVILIMAIGTCVSFFVGDNLIKHLGLLGPSCH